MSRSIHLRLDVRGALRNRAFNDGLLERDDGTPLTPDEAFGWLCDQLVAGREYVPAGKCDNWSASEQRCMGHDSDAAREGK